MYFKCSNYLFEYVSFSNSFLGLSNFNNNFRGGGSTYSPSNSSLDEGYTTNFRKNSKIVIGDITLTVTDLQGDTATLEVNGESYTIDENGELKIDANNDGYYDVQVNAGSVNEVYATLTFKTIYEETPKEEQESVVSNIVGSIEETVGDKWIWILIGVAGLVLLIFVRVKVLKRR